MIGSIPEASTADVDAAVAAARAAFDGGGDGGWRRSTAAERSKMLGDMADSLEEQRDEFAGLETMDCGKPLEESKADMDFCVEIMRYYARITPGEFEPQALETGDAEFAARIDKEPLGVVGCITPWNYPLTQSVNKIAPAIAAGCTVVLKPSPLASLTNLMLGRLAVEASLPAGVGAAGRQTRVAAFRALGRVRPTASIAEPSSSRGALGQPADLYRLRQEVSRR